VTGAVTEEREPYPFLRPLTDDDHAKRTVHGMPALGIEELNDAGDRGGVV